MPRFSVTIAETTGSFEAPADSEPTPLVRDLFWEGEAADQTAANDAALIAWDEKYGPGLWPAGNITRINQLDPAGG